MAANGFLSAPAVSDTSKHRRSASVTPSQRSSKSRITLVEDDFGLNADQAEQPGNLTKVVTYRNPSYTWRDHLRGLLCFNASQEKDFIVEESFEPTHVLPEPEMDQTFSPWVLPVYVLSTRRDTEKHQVPKEAKCTIDTGNMQGNIVSREFVENVLGFSEANFCELTPAEKEGGTSVTGHKLIPDGAIYLTWYHKKSTRVFRNMRFLISPNQQCDLIIGARSIEKDKLLTVPNLMAGAGAAFDKKGTLYITFPEDTDETRKTLWKAWYPLHNDAVKLDGDVTVLKRDEQVRAAARLQPDLDKADEKLSVSVLVLHIYDLGYSPDKDPSKLNNAEKNLLETYFEKLEAIKGYGAEKARLEKITGRKLKQA